MILIKTVYGSTLYGTDLPEFNSDVDTVAVQIEEPVDILGIEYPYALPEALVEKVKEGDSTIFTLRKFMKLATKNAPTCLEVLYAPRGKVQIFDSLGLGEELQALAPKIVSKTAFFRYYGFLKSEKYKILVAKIPNTRLQEPGVLRTGYDTKALAHCYRLVNQGVDLLTTGEIKLPLDDKVKDRVIELRRGCMPRGEVHDFLESLAQDLEYAYNRSSLPDTPDLPAINKWLESAYRRYWGMQNVSKT